MAKPAQKKPAAAAPAAEVVIPKTNTSKVHERHVAQVVATVGHSLQKAFPGLGYTLVVFDKRRPDQIQHFAGGDRAASITALGTAMKKLGGV